MRWCGGRWPARARRLARPAWPTSTACSGERRRPCTGRSARLWIRHEEATPAARRFSQLTDAYFRPAPADRAVLLLVDSRHRARVGPGCLGMARSQPCPRGVVGTKVDKLTRAERTRNARELESLFDIPVPLVSAQHGEGLDELWKMIARLPSQRRRRNRPRRKADKKEAPAAAPPAAAPQRRTAAAAAARSRAPPAPRGPRPLRRSRCRR